MKWFFCTITFIFFCSPIIAQSISGRWVGRIYQGKGEFCRECDIELLLNQTTNISGSSHHIQKDSADVKMYLSGYFDKDSIRLAETESKQQAIWLVFDTVEACYKSYNLKYQVAGNREFLVGHMEGRGITTNIVCIPARVIFSRDIESLNYLSSVPEDSLKYVLQPYLPVSNFAPEFNSTSIKKTFEVEVSHLDLQLRLSDYLKVDNDTVSVYLNRQLLTKDVWISKKVVKINFKLDLRSPTNELLLFAENLGKVPPNTSLLEIIDADKTYKIKIESDKQKTAAIYLRYKPKPND